MLRRLFIACCAALEGFPVLPMVAGAVSMLGVTALAVAVLKALGA